jgi:hypothetical protein
VVSRSRRPIACQRWRRRSGERRGEHVEHGAQALGVGAGGDHAGGLVEREDHGAGGEVHGPAVHAHRVAGAQERQRLAHHAVADGHAAGADRGLRLAGREHAGARQGALEPVLPLRGLPGRRLLPGGIEPLRRSSLGHLAPRRAALPAGAGARHRGRRSVTGRRGSGAARRARARGTGVT